MRRVHWRGWLKAVLITVIAAGLLATSPAGAIVNGQQARLRDHRWLMSIHDVDGHVCGGVLIERDVVLTAAHCTEGYFPSDLEIVAGSVRSNPRRAQRRPVADIVEHHRYHRADGFDIALVFLDRPMRLNGRVATIERATRAEMRAAATTTVAGWGALHENGRALARRMLEAEIPLVSDAACNKALAEENEFMIPRREMCAGGLDQGSCYGDSGGPLVIDGFDGRPKVVGLVSWGIVCGGHIPGVNVEVPHFNGWIDRQL